MLTNYQIKQLNQAKEQSLALNKHKTLIFPFIFTNGATDRRNQALGQFGQLRRLFDGKNSVLVRGLNSRQPMRLENDQPKLSFQKGVVFEAYNYSYDLFNQFLKDEVSETVELLNYKTLKLICNTAQLKAWFGLPFLAVFTSEQIDLKASVDDTGLSILYYLPEVSETDLFFIESATLLKDMAGELNSAEVILRSLTTELRQSGRAWEQWVNFATPGDQYALPVLTKDGFHFVVKNNPGARFVQLETDDAYALNSLVLYGRPTTADLSVFETPRMLFFAYPVPPILNTVRKSYFMVQNYRLVKGNFLNDFFYATPKPNFLAELEAQYNPLQKRETNAYFAIQQVANSNFIDGQIQDMTKRGSWQQGRHNTTLASYDHPVRFFASRMSRETFQTKLMSGTTIQVPDVTTHVAVANEIEVLNLNAISFYNNNHFTIGNKVYTQSAIGAFSGLITSATTGLLAGLGAALGGLVGAAAAGYAGQALSAVGDSAIKAGATTTKVENPDTFQWVLFVPDIIYDKMKKLFTNSNRIPLALFMGDKNYLTALGVGKLPTVLTFQLTDTFANGKTSLDAISKTGNFDIKTEHKTKAVLQAYAIDSGRLLGLGMCNIRLSFYDANKNLVYTTFQQSQAKYSENILDAATESITSDYDAMTNALPPGFNNILDAKLIPANLLRAVRANELDDLNLIFPVQTGFAPVRTGSVRPSLGALPIKVDLQLQTNYDLATLYRDHPDWGFTLAFTIKLSGSYHEQADYTYLPIINGMTTTRYIHFAKPAWEQLVGVKTTTSTQRIDFDTFNYPRQHLLYRQRITHRFATPYTPTTVDAYAQGKLSLTLQIRYTWHSNFKLSVTLFNFTVIPQFFYASQPSVKKGGRIKLAKTGQEKIGDWDFHLEVLPQLKGLTRAS